MKILENISELLSMVKYKNPLIHHITNYVTVNDCANIVLSLGGSPVMADDINEVEEMTSISSALVLNIGTLNSRSIESMLLAGKKANSLGIPVILDPVGVGATSLRTSTAKKLLQEINFSVIRGNMSEIKVLSGNTASIKGVDSTEGMQGAEQIAYELSNKLNCVIAITGKQDVISNGKNVCIVDNGHKIMSGVTGTGCMCTSLVGTYCGVTKDYYSSAISGIVSIGIAGEKAYTSLGSFDGIGTFKTKLFDNIYNLSGKDILEYGKACEKSI